MTCISFSREAMGIEKSSKFSKSKVSKIYYLIRTYLILYIYN
ncbi:hypothetical protein EW15_1095 [Prochlorococcus sp. MIT 0801]|nr:hypothetical protein EW15_1095 [Prochlorococcus sp. MIT 0801]